jgi:hypothetical protein
MALMSPFEGEECAPNANAKLDVARKASSSLPFAGLLVFEHVGLFDLGPTDVRMVHPHTRRLFDGWGGRRG